MVSWYTQRDSGAPEVLHKLIGPEATPTTPISKKVSDPVWYIQLLTGISAGSYWFVRLLNIGSSEG